MKNLSNGLRRRKSTILPTFNSTQTLTPIKRRKRYRPIITITLLHAIPSFFVIVAIIILSKPSHRHDKRMRSIEQSAVNIDTPQAKSESITYIKPVIICQDQSKGILNDDYCDCDDGRDEPNTAACSHILIRQASFRCIDGSAIIFPSRIADGVIDCSDGSDEYVK